MKKFLFLFIAILFFGCSTKKYEMYKSPCACFEEVKVKVQKSKENLNEGNNG